MSNTTDVPVNGWMPAPQNRGTTDILWSCGLTICLCCWVSVYPNVGSPSDRWYHRSLDKFNLCCIALLGPDFLFGIAFGQWSKARESVQLFHHHPPSPSHPKWKYDHAFFVNSGGVHLKSPDFPQGFPINAQQLHYLIKHGFVTPLDLDSMDIDGRNTVDSLSRVITILQTTWFFAGIVQRACTGLSMTTMELTTSSFALFMFATWAAWYHKPSITQPRFICTNNATTIHEIREFSQVNTHRDLPTQWSQTPLEYLSQEYFGINVHWSYYTRLSYIFKIRVFTRAVKSRPWDRFPSDTWLRPSFFWTIPATCLMVVFSILLMAGWNFTFPTNTEKIMWRVCSVYHAVFSFVGATYYLIEMSKTMKRQSYSVHFSQDLQSDSIEENLLLKAKTSHVRRPPAIFAKFLDKWNNTLPNQVSEAIVPLRLLIPITMLCALYCLCRTYIYVEDIISLRSQPSSVYTSSNLLNWGSRA